MSSFGLSAGALFGIYHQELSDKSWCHHSVRFTRFLLKLSRSFSPSLSATRSHNDSICSAP